MTRRDAAVVAALADARYLTREQVQALLFPGMTAATKCQERLRKLTERKQVKRKRTAEGFVYYGEKWSEKWRHWVAVNWVYVSLVTQAKSWQKVSVFTREYAYADLRADALVCIDNVVQKKRQIFFLEADNATNPFGEKYGPVFDKLELALEPPWWYRDGAFPPVLVVTPRPDKVRQVVEGSQVKYHIATLEEVRRDVFSCVR